MKRMRTFLMYASWVVLFFIFSEFLINVSLESSYETIGRKDNIPQVTIYQAEATRVNGRLKGKITNLESNPLSSKYLKIDFYSPRDVNLGTKYIDVSDLKQNETRDLEMHFELEDVSYYEISETDEKNGTEIKLLPDDLTKGQIIVATMFTLLMFW